MSKPSKPTPFSPSQPAPVSGVDNGASRCNAEPQTAGDDDANANDAEQKDAAQKDAEQNDAEQNEAKAGIVPGDQNLSVRVGERERNYLVHAPPNFDPTSPVAIVFVFHGGGTNANWLRRFCGLSNKADEANFLAVFPSGSGVRARRLSWNCPGSGFERWVDSEGAENCQQQQADEVAFVRAMIDDLANRCAVDRRRVFASGVSTGAILVYYLACMMSNEIAAIGPVGGPMGEYLEPPSRPMPIIHFHGTADNFAPYNGGHGERSFTGLDFHSVDFTINTWAKFNGCTTEPVVEKLPQKMDNLTHVTKSRFACRDGAEIELYTIWEGGHTWPGQDPRMELMGKYTEDIRANDLMWDFFQRHPLPESLGGD